MGQWGEWSCDGDSCWDALSVGGDNIHKMTSKGIGLALESLEKEIKDRSKPYKSDLSLKQDFVGVAIWGLRQKLKVDIKLLEMAVEYAEEMLSSKDYLNNWREPDSRSKHLVMEIEEMQKAVTNGGRGKGGTTTSLFGRMAGLSHDESQVEKG